MRQKHFYGVALAVFALASIVGCESLDHTYPDQKILFSDTLQTYAVKDNPEDLYKVVIGTTKAYQYDRNLSVEVVASKSTAIHGVHYTLEDNNAFLPAGKMVAEIAIKGNYDAIENTDGTPLSVDSSLEAPYVTLRVVDREADVFDYTETRVVLRKFHPFNIDDFLEDGGYQMVYTNAGTYLTKVEKLDDYRLVYKNIIKNNRDMIVNFQPYDDPVITHQAVVFPQVLGYYDQHYPDLTAASIETYPSLVYPFTREIYFILFAYVDGYGGVGYLQLITKWISEDDAKKYEDYEEIKDL